jgi:hypothetical protein
MLDRGDATFAVRLERKILQLLEGDTAENGLFRQLLTVNDWDTFNRSKARILALEEVLKVMQEVRQEMNAS